MSKILTLSALVIALALLSTPTARAEVVDGVEEGLVVPKDSLPGSLNFEPPGLFIQSVPLVLYLNKNSGITKFTGKGVVLNVGSFSVTGLSSPNGLAWNCNATNADGTVPVLPETITFKTPMTQVSIKVASGSGAGQIATLTSGKISTSVVLSTAAQTLTLNAPKIKKIVLSGPCVMVADDLAYN